VNPGESGLMRLYRTESEHCHCPSIHAAEDLALALVMATIVRDYFLLPGTWRRRVEYRCVEMIIHNS
jgi:hypothetical protein